MNSRDSTFFLPKPLTAKLWQVSSFATTIIAAPSGYGKTTAVRQLQLDTPDADFFWSPPAWEDARNGWRGFCEQIAQFDPDSAMALIEVDYFTDPSLAWRAADILRKLNCPAARHTYLMIDDFHAMRGLVPASIVTALINHTCERLHLILMGQAFELPFVNTYGAYALNWIGEEDLMFWPEDIRKYFLSAGLVMTDAEAMDAFDATQGWAAAVHVRLQDAMRQGDGSVVAQRIGRLIAYLSFDRLSAEQKKDLLCLAFFERVTEDDLCALWAVDELGDEQLSLLASVPMLLRDPEDGSFRVSQALRDFWLGRLRTVPEPIRKEVYGRAGRRFARRKDPVQAIACFHAVENYEAILSMDLKLLSYTKIGNVYFDDIAREIVANCPMEVKLANPISFLRVAYHLYGAGDYTTYRQALAQAATFMQPNSASELYGEWLLISMLDYLPDVEKMHAVLLEAERYLQGPARSIPREEPFLFGCPSIWFAFYSQPGKGDEIAVKMAAWLYDYQRLLGGRGVGADQLYRGELASMQMRLREAANYAHTAAALGEQARQPTVIYGAALLLARVAIARQDMEGAHQALLYLERSSVQFPIIQGTAMHAYMLASVRSLILSMMQEMGMAPDVYGHVDRLPRGDSLLAQLTMHVRVVDLMTHGEFERGMGEMVAVLSEGPPRCNTVMRMIISVAVAGCLTVVGMQDEALPLITQALELSYEDRMMTVFVNHREALRPLLMHPSLSKYQRFIREIYAQNTDFSASNRSDRVLAQDTEMPDSLTARELEVATLAAKGMRNAEIANKLVVTESTVKKHLQRIFEKLDIDRRSRLIERLGR